MGQSTWGVCWFASMSFFLYIVYELLVGLAAATAAEPNPEIAKKIGTAQLMTVISWCTYPIVYLFPMLGFSAAKAIVGIQMGYCASDIISKCGVGLVIYQISYAKSSKQYLLQRACAWRWLGVRKFFKSHRLFYFLSLMSFRRF